MFNISNHKPDTQIFEIVKGKDLKRIYSESIFEMKKIFGFIVLTSYPNFYQRTSIINEVGLQFLYIKDFLDEDEIYISYKRLSYNFNLILEGEGINKIYDLQKLIDNLKLWIDNKNYTYYNSNKYINKIKKVNAHIEHQNFTSIDISFETLNNIKKLISDKPMFIINDINNKHNVNIIPSIDSIPTRRYTKYYYLLKIKTGWVIYIISINQNKNIKLEYFQNIGIPIEKSEENLIFINHLYLSINKIIDRHFYIKLINPKNKNPYKKIPYLEQALFLLNKKAK